MSSAHIFFCCFKNDYKLNPNNVATELAKMIRRKIGHTYLIITVNNFSDLSADYITIGSIFGLLVGIFLHELGHMFACIAYGGEVFEVGVMLQFFLPGAYVLMNKNRIKNRLS